MFMLKRLVLAAVIMLAASLTREAQAGFVSGWDLLEICKANPNDPSWRIKAAQCSGYVIGVADTFDCKNALHGFHWDSTTTTSQQILVKKVITWLNDHPQTLNHEADGLIAAALGESFPCR